MTTMTCIGIPGPQFLETSMTELIVHNIFRAM